MQNFLLFVLVIMAMLLVLFSGYAKGRQDTNEKINDDVNRTIKRGYFIHGERLYGITELTPEIPKYYDK